MLQQRLVFLFAALLTFSACATRSGRSDTDAGPTIDAGARDSSAGDRDSGPIARDAGPPDPQAPRILMFSSNVSSITQGESVTFTVVATDPDGVEDLIGGSLVDPSTDTAYGALATSASEGSYAISISWDEIHRVRPIEFTTDGGSRVFEARLFDVAGHVGRGMITIALSCDGDGACDGRCTDLSTETNCRGCGVECGSFAFCGATSCECAEGYGDCGGECVRLDTRSHCGSCDQSCGVGESCFTPMCETSIRFRPEVLETPGARFFEVLHDGVWRGVCDDNFDANDGAVACRSLGGSYVSHETARLGPIDEFWLDGLNCEGDEEALEDCDHLPWGRHDCSQREWVAIVCSGV